MAIDNVYRPWNVKHRAGKTELNNSFLSQEAAKNNTEEMNCTIGVDTFSANDLQNVESD